MTTAFVVKAGDKFACVTNGKLIGRSKDQDYFRFHYLRHDVKALNDANIEQFVYVDENGGIRSIVKPHEQVNQLLVKQAKAVANIIRGS